MGKSVVGHLFNFCLKIHSLYQVANAHCDALCIQPNAVDNHMTDKNDNHEVRKGTQLAINIHNFTEELGFVQ